MDNVKKHFEEEAQAFDRIVVTLIPGYARMLEALVAALPFERSAPLRVIDLGCGSGTVAERVLEAFPNAQLTCLDLAQNMIAMARVKLERHRQVRYMTGDLNTFEFDGNYHAAVSSLALHHLPADDDKRRFYRRVYAGLRSGGVFYNADMVLGSTDSLQAEYMRQWRAFMLRAIPLEEIESRWIPNYLAEDRPAKLMHHIAWLTEAGFADVDVVWKRYNFAVYGGAKP